MKTYTVSIVGNDLFSQTHLIVAESMEDAAKSLPSLLEIYGKMTIEQFVQVSIGEVQLEDDLP